MKNKLFSLMLAGAMLSGAAQVKANESYALGLLAGASANIVGSAIILKAADGILSSINNNNTTDVALLSATTFVAQMALSVGSFRLYKKISKDKLIEHTTKISFGIIPFFSALFINAKALDNHYAALHDVAVGSAFGGLVGGAINLLS